MPLNQHFNSKMKIHRNSYFILAVAILMTILVFSYLNPNNLLFALNANKERVKIKKLPEALIIGSPKCGKFLK